MAVDCESLRDALFFQVLKRRFRPLWTAATKRTMLVCVPQSKSLSGASLVEEDMGQFNNAWLTGTGSLGALSSLVNASCSDFSSVIVWALACAPVFVSGAPSLGCWCSGVLGQCNRK
jgi:hypothetical protein